MFPGTIIRGVFEIYSERSSIVLFWDTFTSAGRVFISGGGDWALGGQAIILWHFEIFLIFLNFLRSYVLSSLAACEAIRLDQFITNNHDLFHLR